MTTVYLYFQNRVDKPLGANQFRVKSLKLGSVRLYSSGSKANNKGDSINFIIAKLDTKELPLARLNKIELNNSFKLSKERLNLSVSKLDKNSQVLKYLEEKSLNLEVKFTDINDKIILEKLYDFTQQNAKLLSDSAGVYIIKHKFSEEFYIGSTSNFVVRLSDHKNSFNLHRKLALSSSFMDQ